MHKFKTIFSPTDSCWRALCCSHVVRWQAVCPHKCAHSLRHKFCPFCLLGPSNIYLTDDKLVISFDHLEELGQTFVQIKGYDRQVVAETAAKLGLSVCIVVVGVLLMQLLVCCRAD